MATSELNGLHALVTGGVVWFEPGIIHRLVNTSGDLEIFVVMQNAGLPEAGDAVLTFPDDILGDPGAYRQAAGIAGEDRLAEAARRRDLAVEGFAAYQADEVRVLGEELEAGAEHVVELRPALRGAAGGLLDPHEPLGEEPLEHLGVQLVLAGEVVQQAGLGDADRLRDLPERRSRVAALGERLPGGLEDGLPG